MTKDIYRQGLQGESNSLYIRVMNNVIVLLINRRTVLTNKDELQLDFFSFNDY